MSNTSEFQDQGFDPLTKIRNLEDRLNLLKERVILVGQTHIEEREKTFVEIQELKKDVFLLKEENKRLKELINNIIEQLEKTARAEDLEMLQRQFDIFRK